MFLKQIGEFGPPNVEIVSFFASDPDSGDAVFSTGDEIGIDFNIPTNQADLPDNAVTRAQLDSVFQFSMSIGQDYVGRWNTPASLRITILNATEDPSNQLFHPPYVGFSGLKVSVKKSGLLYALQIHLFHFQWFPAVTCAAYQEIFATHPQSAKRPNRFPSFSSAILVFSECQVHLN